MVTRSPSDFSGTNPGNVTAGRGGISRKYDSGPETAPKSALLTDSGLGVLR